MIGDVEQSPPSPRAPAQPRHLLRHRARRLLPGSDTERKATVGRDGLTADWYTQLGIDDLGADVGSLPSVLDVGSPVTSPGLGAKARKAGIAEAIDPA